MLQYGLRQGLAQDLGYDQQINDLRYHQQANQQAKLMAEKKAAMFADDMQWKNAMNSFDNPRVKAIALAQIKDIGAYANDNLDMLTNVTKRAIYNQMVHNLKDNPDLNRGMQSDANYAQLTKDLAEESKHPELFNKKGFEEQLKRWDNYNNFGNADGEEAAKKEGFKFFQYERPKDKVDLALSGLEKGNKFNDFNIKSIKGGFAGSYQEVPNEQSLNAVANDEYLRNKWQYDEEYSNKGYATPFDYAKANIRSGIKTKFDMGDAGASLGFMKYKDSKTPEAPIKGNWENDIVGTPIGQKFNADISVVPGEVLQKVFGVKPPLKIMSDDKTQELDLTGHEYTPSGPTFYVNAEEKKRGVRTAVGIIKMSKKEAQENKILSNNYLEHDEIDPSWKGQAKLKTETNKNGKDIEYVEIVAPYKFNVNSSTLRGLYNQLSDPAKLAGMPAESYQKQQIYKDETGNKFISDGNGGWLPYQ